MSEQFLHVLMGEAFAFSVCGTFYYLHIRRRTKWHLQHIKKLRAAIETPQHQSEGTP